MRAALAAILVVVLTFTGTVTAQPQVSPDVWRQVAGKVPIGSVVKVRTVSRESLKGVLFAVDDTGIIVKPKTRVPEPARRVTFDQIDDLRITNSRGDLGKAAGIGAALGAVFLASIIVIFSRID